MIRFLHLFVRLIFVTAAVVLSIALGLALIKGDWGTVLLNLAFLVMLPWLWKIAVDP